MKKSSCIVVFWLTILAVHAQMSVSPWTPIFKGIDTALGTNRTGTMVTTPVPGGGSVVWVNNRLQAVRCVRVDLSDPDVQLSTTPRAANYVAESSETLSLTVSNFLKNNGLKVAGNANFYNASPGGSDPQSEGVPCEVYGLMISTGTVVSAADSGDGGRYASLMFTTNKTPVFALNNRPPGTNTAGIYSAVTGYYPVLTNGVNLWAIYSNQLASAYPDASMHDPQPRTSYGVSQDGRYLFMMVIDGRQGGYSDGAIDQETGQWLLLFGASDGLNMDGGGSSTMYMADCAGNPVALTHSAYVATGRGRERYIGSHFGVSAKPLSGSIADVTIQPGDTVATINWTTAVPASSQVAYGLTSAYGLLSALDATLVTNHSVTLNGLAQGTRYYYRILSSTGTDSYTLDGCAPFRTTNAFVASSLLLDLTNAWKFNTTNMDAVPAWKAPGFNDSGWPAGRGVLWCDNRNPGGNAAIQFLPLGTTMPVTSGGPPYNYPYTTYYLRTRFVYASGLAGVTLTFSNYLDDGAVFYLNGVEIQRSFMPAAPTTINNSTLASTYLCTGIPPAPCSGGNATYPYVFAISGNLATNLIVGTNVLAVEVHNYSATSPDITFGCALSYTVPPPPFITNLTVVAGETSATVSWTTISNSTSQVLYGLTTNLGSATTLDATLVTNHAVTLTGLALTNHYYFTVVSVWGATQFTAGDTFATVPFYQEVMDLTDAWRYTTNNLDGTPNWFAPAYNDSAWLSGQALLWVDLRAAPNADVQPKFTALPWNTTTALPWTTYYFRSRFTVTNPPGPGFTFVMSNYVDDGAVFYLNGVELRRLRMTPAPAAINHATFATGEPATTDAVDADVFRLWGSQLTNLVAGTNLLAVEVHNASAASPDITFGSALGWVRSLASETLLRIGRSNNVGSIAWDGRYLTLQRSGNPGDTNSWADVSGSITNSPYSVTNPAGALFFRLRN